MGYSYGIFVGIWLALFVGRSLGTNVGMILIEGTVDGKSEGE